jgi:hypothetical protein
VKLSCAIGQALYPHSQWQRLSQLWDSFYPMRDLPEGRRQLLTRLTAGIPSFVTLLINHRPRSLRGQTLGEVLSGADRQPERLMALYQAWRASPSRWATAPPGLAFAVIGQARAAGQVTPEEESRLVANLLTTWALRNTLDTTASCAPPLTPHAALAA